MKKIIPFLFVLAFFSCKKNKEFIVSGYVKNGNIPLANATVSIDKSDDFKVQTDNKGYYFIDNVPKGKHIIATYKESSNGSFVTKSQEIELNSDQEATNFVIPNPTTLFQPEILSEISNDKIKLSWSKTDASDFYEYRLYKHNSSALDENTATLVHISTSINDTIFTDSIAHNSNYYYRLYIRNLNDKVGGSNIVNVVTGPFVNNPEILLSETKLCNISKNDNLWFYFLAETNEFYKVTWTTADIYVAGYAENKTDLYFSKDRLIQMQGAPKTIFSNSTSKVYLNVENYDQSKETPFSFKVDKIDKLNTPTIQIGNSVTFQIALGEVKLYSIDFQKDSTYTVSMSADEFIGAYGDNVDVTISSFSGVTTQSYFLNERPDVVAWSGSPKNKIITPIRNEKMYLSITGAYWWNPRTVTIKITK